MEAQIKELMASGVSADDLWQELVEAAEELVEGGRELDNGFEAFVVQVLAIDGLRCANANL